MHNHTVGGGGHAHAGFVAEATVTVQTLPAGAVQGLRGVAQVGRGVHPSARFSIRHGHGHGGTVTAHLHAITRGQFGGVDRLGCVNGGVLRSLVAELNLLSNRHTTVVVFTLLICSAQGTGEDLHVVLGIFGSPACLSQIFSAQAGVFGGGQGNLNLEGAVFIGDCHEVCGRVAALLGQGVNGLVRIIGDGIQEFDRKYGAATGSITYEAFTAHHNLAFAPLFGGDGDIRLHRVRGLGVSRLRVNRLRRICSCARLGGGSSSCAGLHSRLGGRLCSGTGLSGRRRLCSCARFRGRRGSHGRLCGCAGLSGRLSSCRRLCGRCGARLRIAQRNILRHRCTTVVGVAVRIHTAQGTGKHLNTVTGTLHGPTLGLQMFSGQTGVFGGRQGHYNLEGAVLVRGCHEVRGRVAALLGERVNRLVSLIRQGVEELHREHGAATGSGAGKAGSAQHELAFAPLLGGDGHGSLISLLGGGGSIRECDGSAGQRCSGGDERAGESHDGTVAGCGAHGSSFGHCGP